MPTAPTPRKLPVLLPEASGATRSAAATRLSPAARALHLAILHAFAATGRPPAPDTLERQARTPDAPARRPHDDPVGGPAGGRGPTPHGQSGAAPGPGTDDVTEVVPLDTSAAMAELLAADAVVLDDTGAIVAAYPFSATPTLHRVEISGGPTVFAMCAVDALGMSAMLARPVAITAREPDSDRQVRVEVDGGTAAFQPATAVVFAGTTGDWCCGPAAVRRCGTINFFTTAQAAESWAARHPEVSGQVIDQQQALAWGVREFAGLLGRGEAGR